MMTIKSFVRASLFTAAALGFAVLSMPANACTLCGGIKLNGPILNGPILQGPILQGPILQGLIIQGAATHGTQSGRVISVTLPSGVTVPVR